MRLYLVLVSIILTEVSSSCPKSNITRGPTLQTKDIKTSLREIGLGVDGIVYLRALEIEEKIQNGVEMPFKELIKGNLADPQLFGQKPLTFVRQLLPLVTYPHLLDLPLDDVFPTDIKRKAKLILSGVGANSIGTYSNSWGVPLIRKHIASFITTRDGGIPSDWRDIAFTNGVYDGAFTIMELLQHDCSGMQVAVMTPIPVYPLFSLAIEKFGFQTVSYKLNSSNNWSLDVQELDRAYDEALCNCNCQIRAIVIINPGNPTGMVIPRNTIEEIIRFAHNRSLLILVDEIYQETIMKESLTFVSFKKVLREMNFPINETTELISFHGVSKGYFAESGLRGGYFELTNIDPGVKDVLTKMLNLKLCSNLLGQVVMDCLADPPKPGDPSYDVYIHETTSIMTRRRLMYRKLIDGINSIPGLHVQEIESGLVVFVKLTLPPASLKDAQAKGIKPDELYALELLDQTGLATTPGSAFSMPEDQPYIRIVIPLDSTQADLTIDALRTFQPNFTRKYES